MLYRKVAKDDENVEKLPQVEITIYLSSKKIIYERTKYSFFTLLSDFGGFYGAIIMIPNLFFSFYAQNMFSKSITSQTHIINKHPLMKKDYSGK